MKSLYTLLLTWGAFALPCIAQSTVWHLDPPHSAAQFSVRHMGISTVRGTFTKVTGIVTFDPADLSKTILDITIDPASVDSRVEMRDNDLRGEHFFDVAKYPTITFKSARCRTNRSGQTHDRRRSYHSWRYQARGPRRRRAKSADEDADGHSYGSICHHNHQSIRFWDDSDDGSSRERNTDNYRCRIDRRKRSARSGSAGRCAGAPRHAASWYRQPTAASGSLTTRRTSL